MKDWTATTEPRICGCTFFGAVCNVCTHEWLLEVVRETDDPDAEVVKDGEVMLCESDVTCPNCGVVVTDCEWGFMERRARG